MLWAHQLQPAAARVEISQLQVNGHKCKKRSEVKQHLRAACPYPTSISVALARPLLCKEQDAAHSCQLLCGPSQQYLPLAEIQEAGGYL